MLFFERGQVERWRIQTGDSTSYFPSLHSYEALFHTFSDASAAHRRNDTGQYYSVWDLTIQVTSYMINPDFLHSRGKEAISAKFRGLLSRRFSDGLCCQGKGQMRKLFVSFHSFCSENLFTLVITYNERISFIKKCLVSHFFLNVQSWTSCFFFWCCQIVRDWLCQLNCLHVHNFLINLDTEKN